MYGVGDARSSDKTSKYMPILQNSLRDLLQDSFLSSPAVSVGADDKVAEATNLLSHHLETFTDSLVVVDDQRQVGQVGGADILDGVMKNPTADFFVKTMTRDVMNTRLVTLGAEATLGNLIDLWKHTGRAFAVVPNKFHGYSALSARRLLEVAMSCRSNLKMGDIAKKKIVTFRKDQKAREIIASMFENRARKLVLEGTSEFISDRIIIQKISRDLDCLQCDIDFLEMRGDQFQLDRAKKVSDQVSLAEGARLMYGMQSPYLLLSGGVVTPWDIIMHLDSEGIEYEPGYGGTGNVLGR